MICPFKRRLASYWVSTKSKNETWVWVSALDVPINPLAVSHGSALNRKQPISPPFPMLRSSTKWNNQNWTKGLKKYLKNTVCQTVILGIHSMPQKETHWHVWPSTSNLGKGGSTVLLKNIVQCGSSVSAFFTHLQLVELLSAFGLIDCLLSEEGHSLKRS